MPVSVAVALLVGGLGSPALAEDLPVGSDQDVTAPVVTAFDVAPTSVDVTTADATLSASITVSDDLAGLRSAQLLYTSPSRQQTLFISFAVDGQLSGTFTTSALVDTHRENGTWTLSSVSVVDRVGNARSYSAADNLGPSELHVLSNGDTALPTATAVRLSPDPVDVSASSQAVYAEVDAADLGAGVSQLSLTLVSPSGRQFMRGFGGAGERISGDASAGTYRFVLETFNNSWTGSPSPQREPALPRNSQPGEWRLGFLQIFDAARNSRVYSGDALQAMSDAPVLVVSDPTDVAAPTLTAFDFSPRSIDVTSASAAVQVTLDVGDDLSGVKTAWLVFQSPTVDSATPPFLLRSGGNNTRLLAPQLLDGQLTGTVVFPRFDRAGSWTVQRVCVQDWVAHQTCVSGDALTPLGPTSLTVIDTTNAPADTDLDGVADSGDNCPDVSNFGQQDADGDGIGDACDPADDRLALDSDGDGLADLVEIWIGCDPHNADTDGDGVSDFLEVLIGETSPVLVDTFGNGGDGGHLLTIIGAACSCDPGPADGVNGSGILRWIGYWYGGAEFGEATGTGGRSVVDYYWHLCGCGPELADGIPGTVRHYYAGAGSRWIVHPCGCLPWEDPAGGGGIRAELRSTLGGHVDQDSDGDGLIDVIEIMLGCNPADPDSDGDGLDDRLELVFGSDPTSVDTDGDGMDDKREYETGCDPRDPDSDGDGLPDGADPAPRAGIRDCGPTTSDPVVPVGTHVEAAATFIGHGTDGVANGVIEWGDGTADTRTGAGTLTAEHAYTAAGVYTLTCRVVDSTTGTHTTEYRHVVVFDDAAGFVTGGGWIDSPAGAYTPDPTAAGPARFGFVSQYKKGAQVPTGSTEFQFRAAGMSFHASDYQWLVVSGGSTKAQYKGTGTINGEDGYGFLLTAYDLGSGQGVDKLRLKIWRVVDGSVVYDNRLGAADGIDSADPQLLSNGQIVIHRP